MKEGMDAVKEAGKDAFSEKGEQLLSFVL